MSLLGTQKRASGMSARFCNTIHIGGLISKFKTPGQRVLKWHHSDNIFFGSGNIMQGVMVLDLQDYAACRHISAKIIGPGAFDI